MPLQAASTGISAAFSLIALTKLCDITKFFLERKNRANSFYTSYTVVGDKRILWYPDGKHYLLGREIGKEWLEWDETKAEVSK